MGAFEVEPAPTFNNVMLRCVIYLAINSAQPLLTDFLKYNGAAAASTFIYVIPTYAAMVCLVFLPRHKSIWEEDWKKATFLALCDVSHQLMEKAGLIYAGSAVYMVAASSSTVWIAILSYFILRRRLSIYKWLGILTICFALSLKAFQVTAYPGENELFGASLTFVAAILHGLSYVINEAFMTGTKPIEGPNLVIMTGIIGSAILFVWSAVWTIPQWDTLVTQSIVAAGGSFTKAITCFVVLCGCGFIRSATLWYLLKHIGAVSSGIIKGIRTPTVFFLSHILFCSVQSSQCMTSLKATAAILCAIGVSIYSLSDRNSPLQEKPEEETPLIKNEEVATIV